MAGGFLLREALWTVECTECCVDGRVVSRGVLLFHKHENVYVSGQGHLCCVGACLRFLWVRGLRVMVHSPPQSYLYPPPTVVWNCTLSSSVYTYISRACLHKPFFPPLCTHHPQAWGMDGHVTLHILDGRTTRGTGFR